MQSEELQDNQEGKWEDILHWHQVLEEHTAAWQEHLKSSCPLQGLSDSLWFEDPGAFTVAECVRDRPA